MQEKWNVYHAAIYLRLSKDDGDISFSSKKQESNSIQSQRELLTAFLRQHPEMELYGEYKDDGWTGTNFDRPDFQRMLEDVKAGKINCIVVKDLSRFGRDYILCGKYIEKVFPQLGVRFIAVNDGYDTLTATGTDSIVVPFKNLINDSYSRDISIKVRTNLEVKRRQGACIANFAVYGYAKDPEDKNRLVEDPYAAGVVRDIFTWAVEGLSPGSIASRLNQLGVLSPMEYKKSQGLRFKTQFKTSSQAQWSHVAIRRILQNEVYIGNLVQGKRTSPNHKTKKTVVKSQDDWVRVEGTHQAIVPQAQFALVQQLLGQDTRASALQQAVAPYSGRIFCGECGAPMVRKSSSWKGKRYVYYVCQANKEDRETCGKHSLREDVLNQAVLAIVQRQLDTVLDMDRALQKLEAQSWEKEELEKISCTLEVQKELLHKNNTLRLGMYEDLQEGILTREEYSTLKEEIGDKIRGIEESIRKLETGKQEILQGLNSHQSWLAQFRQYAGVTEITRPLVVSLVEQIRVYQDGQVEVTFRHQDQFIRILEFLQQRGKRSNVVPLPQREVG